MYDTLRDIIHKDAQLNNYNLEENTFYIKENASNAVCKKVTLYGFESSEKTMAFELDSRSKNIRCRQGHKISPYFENNKNLDRGNDGVIFTRLKGRDYVFICELKDGRKGYMEQFKSTTCFVDYLRSVLRHFFNINTNAIIFKYIVFSKQNSNLRKTNGKPVSTQEGAFEVYKVECSRAKRYYLQSFL